jgi:hypothetical protein
MSLQATIERNTDAAWAACGDLVEQITIIRPDTGSYNPATSEVVPDAAAVTQFTTDGIADVYTEAQPEPQLTSVVVYIRENQCLFTPTSEHSAAFRGEAWGISGSKNHGRVLHELTLRRPS